MLEYLTLKFALFLFHPRIVRETSYAKAERGHIFKKKRKKKEKNIPLKYVGEKKKKETKRNQRELKLTNFRQGKRKAEAQIVEKRS